MLKQNRFVQRLKDAFLLPKLRAIDFFRFGLLDSKCLQTTNNNPIQRPVEPIDVELRCSNGASDKEEQKRVRK